MVYKNKILLFLSTLQVVSVNGQIAKSNVSKTDECLNQDCGLDRPLELIDPRPIATAPNGPSPGAVARMKKVQTNFLWQEMDRQQGTVPYGKVLDAGTGLNSLQWIASLADDKHGMTSYTAITGSRIMYNDVTKEAKELGIDHMGEIILGNWFNRLDPLTLREQYDTIFVDYLIGAMDFFSPYQQDMMLKKLAPYLKPGGRMYIIGLEPIPDYVPEDDKTTNSVKGANLICQMRRVRDSCALLAGNRPYREYPVEWTHRQFEALNDMKLLKTKFFSNLWDSHTFGRQINNGRNVLSTFPTTELAEEMEKILVDLEEKFLKATQEVNGGKVKFGFDYLITAEKKREDESMRYGSGFFVEK